MDSCLFHPNAGMPRFPLTTPRALQGFFWSFVETLQVQGPLTYKFKLNRF